MSTTTDEQRALLGGKGEMMATTKGIIGFHFDPLTHTYTYDGVPLESVTQVLKRAGQIGDWGTPEDLERGSEVHRLTAAIDRGIPTEVPPELRGYVEAWAKYRRDSGFALTDREHAIYDLKHGIAGTPDRVGFLPVFKAVRVVVDLKTNKAGTIAPWVRYQLAPYAMMLRWTPGERLERIAVALTPEGRYSVQHYGTESLLRDWSQFLKWKKEEENL